MNTRRIGWIVIAAAALAASAGCGTAANQGNATGQTGSAQKPIVLRVGATPVPHAEILNDIKPVLAKEGIDLEVVEFNDYVQPNRALASGQLDANFFQHVPYLNDFNSKNHTDLVPTVAVHFEPLGLYPGRSKSLSQIPDGAHIAVPNDTTNEARALLLLQSAGIIRLKDPNSLSETPQDIVSNPHHVHIDEIDAAAIPRVIQDEDYAVINGNYAIQAGFKPSDALTMEKADSLAAKTYANVVVVRKGHEHDWAIEQLDKAITSAQVKQFIEDKYHGAVVPVFGNASSQ
ncbi:MAG: MetQ/NlpA family ABC transporter substrate-binding protein [Thermoflavifilum sp.]|nr:MetQ/NlpA family ABC transporter substrate-binding protein [Thermoflavifilum sp.]MCL6515143.1 MetQ/NlpA family ABC transporter substrate-binding protein [Alicyclobacillus sp.]